VCCELLFHYNSVLLLGYFNWRLLRRYFATKWLSHSSSDPYFLSYASRYMLLWNLPFLWMARWYNLSGADHPSPRFALCWSHGSPLGSVIRWHRRLATPPHLFVLRLPALDFGSAFKGASLVRLKFQIEMRANLLQFSCFFHGFWGAWYSISSLKEVVLYWF